MLYTPTTLTSPRDFKPGEVDDGRRRSMCGIWPRHDEEKDTMRMRSPKMEADVVEVEAAGQICKT